MDIRLELLPGWQNVLLFFQGQYVPFVSVWSGLCDRIPSQVEGFLQYRSRGFHHGQLHEADYAERRLHNREKDIFKIQFLSTPSAPWGDLTSFDESVRLTNRNSPIVRWVWYCNRTQTACPFNINVDIIRHPNVKNKVFWDDYRTSSGYFPITDLRHGLAYFSSLNDTPYE